MREKSAVWSAVVLVAAAGGGWGLWFYLMQLTPPTSLSLDANNLAVLAPPTISPPMVVQDRAGDSGAEYLKAGADYQNLSDACDQFAEHPEGSPPGPIAGVLDASGKYSVDVFLPHPEVLINYESEHPELDNLLGLGRCMNRVGLLLRINKKVEDGRKYFLAVYALGKKLYDERLTHDEYFTGLSLMNEATIGLSECEDEPGKSDLVKWEGAMRDYDVNHVQPIEEALFSADQGVVAEHAGDVFVFATRAGERMFRVEAVLALGRLRFDAGRKADQLGAGRYIGKLLADPDPAVAAAAKAAGDLTVEEYRTIH
jgi:hypothetical protein